MPGVDEISRLIEESRALERAGEVAASIQRAQQARQMAAAQADTEAEAEALNTLAYAHVRLGHYDQAENFCRQALALAGPESRARAEALLNLNICAAETNDLDTAEEYTLQAVDLSRQIGHHRVLVRGLHALSCGIYMPRGQFSLSLAADEEALNIALARGLPELAWGPLLTMSYVCWLTGQRSLAETRLDQVRQYAAPGSLGDGYWHYIHANLALEAGEVESARSLFSKTLSIAEANGIAENIFLGRIGLSRLSRALNDLPAALDWAAEACALMARTGYRHLQAQALIEHARAAWGLADPAAAESDLRQAIQLMEPMRLNFDLAAAELILAALLRQQARPEAPAAWQKAAERMLQGGFACLAERERALAFPLIASGLASPHAPTARASAALLEHLQQVPPAPLKISTLGGLSVQARALNLGSAALRQRRAGELLAILLISPGRSLPVESVLEAFWPDKDPAAAQALFHHATSSLRRALEPDLPEKFPSRYLLVSEGSVCLRLPAGSRVDYEDFEDFLQTGAWQAALEIYRGDFLPEYRYADWSLMHRQWLAQDMQRAALEVAKVHLAENNGRAALLACRRVMSAEPWQEEAVLLGMRACLLLGDRPGALRLYQNLAKTLRSELGIEPQDDLQTLYRSLLKP